MGKWLKKNLQNIFSGLALIISIASFLISKQAMNETKTQECINRISRLSSSIRVFRELWKDSFEKRIEKFEPSTERLIESKLEILSNIDGAKVYLRTVENESYSRTVFSNGEEKVIKDNIQSFISALENTDFNYYTKKVEIKVLKSTVKSFTDLSNGTLELLKKISCE